MELTGIVYTSGPPTTRGIDVGRALDVSHGSVYRRFPSKASLRDAVAERWLARRDGEEPPRPLSEGDFRDDGESAEHGLGECSTPVVGDGAPRRHPGLADHQPEVRLMAASMSFAIGCTDNQWSRTVLNAIAYQYYVPVLDLGVELQASGAMGGRVTWLAPGAACLWCQQILNGERVRAEQLPASTRADELARGYIQGLDEPAPAVVSINGVVASLAVTELLARTTGFAGSEPRPSVLMYRLADGAVRRTAASTNPDCPTCGGAGQLGLGDLGTPPWTSRTTA